jgi:hypothetical protein
MSYCNTERHFETRASLMLARWHNEAPVEKILGASFPGYLDWLTGRLSPAITNE